MDFKRLTSSKQINRDGAFINNQMFDRYDIHGKMYAVEIDTMVIGKTVSFIDGKTNYTGLVSISCNNREHERFYRTMDGLTAREVWEKTWRLYRRTIKSVLFHPYELQQTK